MSHHPTPSPDPTRPTEADPTPNGRSTPHRQRSLVGRLFAAALDRDPVAAEQLRHLAPGHPVAAAAFEALAVGDYFQSDDPVT
jgi:hypothetical protein